jgi:N-acetylglucosaminyldiphosphoundecaprenol N-acetyl-beta-D-mannosaminyltransferase
MTLEQAADEIVRRQQSGVGGWVVTPNLDILRRATNDREFRRLYNEATIRLADGMPLVWASRLQRTPLPARAAGSDLVFVLAERAARAGASIYLLGGNPGTAERAAHELARRYPGLRIAGLECPPIGFDRDPAEIARIAARLSAASPDIILVALGSPKQEKLIAAVRAAMPSAWFIGVGISFSFVAGDIRRAPVWMRRAGLEWIHRLAQEPRRLAHRYIIDGIPFAFVLLTSAATQGMRTARNQNGSLHNNHPNKPTRK